MQWQFTGGVPLLNSCPETGRCDGQGARGAGRPAALDGRGPSDAIWSPRSWPTRPTGRRTRRSVTFGAWRDGREARGAGRLEVLGFGRQFHTLALPGRLWAGPSATMAASFSTRTTSIGEARRWRWWTRSPASGSIPVHLADVPPGPREEARDDGRLPPGEGAGPSATSSRGFWTGLRRILRRGSPEPGALWREDPLTVARRCHAGAVKVLESCRHRVFARTTGATDTESSGRMAGPIRPKGASMQRRMSRQVLSVLFLAAVAIALLPAPPSTAAAAEVVIAVWTSPEAENLKRAAPVIAQKTGAPRRDRRDRARRLPVQGESPRSRRRRRRGTWSGCRASGCRSSQRPAP